MATSSIYKNVVVKNKVLAQGLVSALENAQNKKSKEVHFSRDIENVPKSEIKKMFEDK